MKLSRALADTAYGLRVAGMSERAVYESFRRNLVDAPSYRDLRRVYADAGVLSRAAALRERKAGTIGFGAHYRAAQADVTRAVQKGYLAESAKPLALRVLNDHYTVGYAYRNGVPSEAFADTPNLDLIEAIEREEGSG